MTRQVRLREVLASVEGLALLRRLYEGTDEEAAARIDELREIVGAPEDSPMAGGVPMREVSAQRGYAEWAPGYDAPGNAIVGIEAPAVERLLAPVPPGVALDAACGTGRHSAALAGRGHQVVGIDASSPMLARARSAVSQASFVEGDLESLPLRSGAVDVAVCALALAHLPRLGGAVGELARVLRAGGHLVVSVLHPTLVALGWHAPYETPDGPRGFVREHDHLHGDYLRAFSRAGLEVVDCVEPRFTEEALPSKRRAMQHVPEATRLAYEGLPAVLVWGLRRA
jgi:ubiquinone/menaquinone biosynthesis C-methylase UbiE